MLPAEHGYFERRTGSGIWYRPDRGTISFKPKVCQNPDCGREFMGRRGNGKGRFCSTSCAKRISDPGYDARHGRVRAVRGPASQFQCVDDCGHQAQDWFQIHGTDGLDVYEHYVPRCRKCHGAYDAETRSRGEQHHTAKLTEAQVRGFYASVGATNQELADRHGGVSREAVSQIRYGDTWKHVTGGRAATW